MTIKPASLRARMAAAALMVSTLTAALLVVGVAVLLDRSSTQDVESRLSAHVDAAAATVMAGRHGVRVLEEKSRLLDQSVWIFDDRRHLIDRA